MDESSYVRNNENLKAPNSSEFIGLDEYENRTREIIRCKNDIVYFAEHYYTIISPGVGKHLIKLYDKQKELLKTLIDNDRVCVLASRQVGKTTTYCIFDLWLTMFHKDKKIMICANKASMSYEFLSRIKLAYELIPNWLKPGIETYNVSKITFDNGSGIAGSATSPDSARGYSADILILDEFAFIPPNISDEFVQSVFPIVSSAKGTKIIMVSTPNGTSNLFYETYNRAELGIDKEGWVHFRIDWWEVPGRNQEWLDKQLATFGGDKRMLAQEYLNKFWGSAYTLINGDILNNLKKDSLANPKKYEEIPINDKFNWFKIKQWYKPEKGRVYIIGADVGEGIGGDYSIALIFDITDCNNIKLSASFANNSISPTYFSFCLTILGYMYNKAYIAIENNGKGGGITITTLFDIFEYENIVNIGNDVRSLGIDSKSSLKNEACINLKDMTNDEFYNFEINDNNIIDEMGWFEKENKSMRSTFKAIAGKHDDYMMSFIWAMYILKTENVEYYYDVSKWGKNKLGVETPLKLVSYENEYYSDSSNNDINNIISKFDSVITTNQKTTPNKETKYNDEYNNIGFIGSETNQIDEWNM